MPPPALFPIPVDQVYFQTGPVAHEHLVGEYLRPAKPWEVIPQFGAVVSWPRALEWLTLELYTLPSTPGAGARDTPFAPNREGLEKVCQAVGVPLDRVAPGNFLGTHAVQAAALSRTSRVRARVTVDTSHDSFLALRERLDPGVEQIVQTVMVRFFFTVNGTPFDQATSIDLVLRPAKSVGVFPGVVAIDLGNTSSVLASLDKGTAVYRTDSIRTLDADAARGSLEASTESVGSEVRLDAVTSFEQPPPGMRRVPSQPADDRPDAIDFVIGRTATSGSAAPVGGLVHGAKRLLASRDAERFRKLQVEHRQRPTQTEQLEEVEVVNRLPAELLVARLFERFRQGALAWPADVAVTYPTTYTPHELARLTAAVERAWLRFQGLPQSARNPLSLSPTDDRMALASTLYQRSLYGPSDGDEAGGLIALKIDEASAAAFFFIYRQIFESPGGLLRFRNLYPRGMNLLIYDCGGGTTDVALVKVTAPQRDLLKLRVLSRTGMRGFGGDNITYEVGRLLKAKLQFELGRLRGRAPKHALPAKNPDAELARRNVEQFITASNALDAPDELVPTKFRPDRLDAGSLQNRRHANDLRRWAEDFKARLGDAPTAKLGKLQAGTNALTAAMVAPFPDAQKAQALQALENVSVHRWEVDALIAPVIKASTDKCRRLVRDTLQAGDDPFGEEMVDRVVASGNACRYPLVEEYLRRELVDDFLEPDDGAEAVPHADAGTPRFLLDPAHLKGSVAKGAVMALMTMRALRSVRIEFESNLSGCLPFSVGYHNLQSGVTTLLYREHAEYRKLAPRPITIAEATGFETGPPPGAPQTFLLERLFPGDDGFQPYLAFEFGQGIQGDLEISYDESRQTFLVRDTVSGASPDPIDQTDASVDLPPMYRGDL